MYQTLITKRVTVIYWEVISLFSKATTGCVEGWPQANPSLKNCGQLFLYLSCVWWKKYSSSHPVVAETMLNCKSLSVKCLWTVATSDNEKLVKVGRRPGRWPHQTIWPLLMPCPKPHLHHASVVDWSWLWTVWIKYVQQMAGMWHCCEELWGTLCVDHAWSCCGSRW